MDELESKSDELLDCILKLTEVKLILSHHFGDSNEYNEVQFLIDEISEKFEENQKELDKIWKEEQEHLEKEYNLSVRCE